jgi:hypothetical protein
VLLASAQAPSSRVLSRPGYWEPEQSPSQYLSPGPNATSLIVKPSVDDAPSSRWGMCSGDEFTIGKILGVQLQRGLARRRPGLSPAVPGAVAGCFASSRRIWTPLDKALLPVRCHPREAHVTAHVFPPFRQSVPTLFRGFDITETKIEMFQRLCVVSAIVSSSVLRVEVYDGRATHWKRESVVNLDVIPFGDAVR